MITLIDYGMGNVASVLNALKQTGRECKVTADPEQLRLASCLVLPGVGAFRDAVEQLGVRGLRAVLDELVLTQGKPFVGFCLGMQLLATRGFEDGVTDGLGWIPGEVRRIEGDGLRVPHMGWNDVSVRNADVCLSDLPDDNFYFMHSYHFVVDDQEHVTSVADYGGPLVSSVRKGNIVGTQFHPEKSQRAGITLLKRVFEELC